MRTKFSVVVDGIKLSDVPTLMVMQDQLDDLVWSSINGRVTFSSSVAEGVDVVCAASEAARRVLYALPGSNIVGAERDIVSAADVAERIGVSRETVRTWARGMRGPGGFPMPVGTVGGGARGGTDIWYWCEVQAWLEAKRGFVFDERSPSVVEMAAMDGHFKHAPTVLDHQFRSAQSAWTSQAEATTFKQKSTVLRNGSPEGWATVSPLIARRSGSVPGTRGLKVDVSVVYMHQRMKAQ
ncbi:hypothetical protein [Cellulosimicrobium sp. Marseille-Q4280]|uniref:hypothetical protein n=1 Tax=Cellulosimicrobium sp. Marseille-Q4280 TaxID=2937992 RepID=UPI00203F6D16|nr:hypothetical protein [Cellulosimicrobium sp. Marseille-Q4280]